jgi:UPF0176 protein
MVIEPQFFNKQENDLLWYISPMSYWVLAYYSFTPVENPEEEVIQHKFFFKDRDITCRIYLSTEGINGQMSAKAADGQAYIEWLKSRPGFQNITFKIDPFHEHVFPRATVKVRSQLVAFDVPVDMSQTGEHLSPQEWKEMLENRDATTLLVDVRNRYEWELGHFEGAELPKLEQFREFPDYVDNLKTTHDPKTTRVMMYCTGGIRCEVYSAFLKQNGFEKVYQLDGGVINYGHQEGKKHWRGKLFVFDDRLSTGLTSEEDVISSCRHCQAPADLYYNCANMDCNELFFSCPACAEKSQGCCQETCLSAPRLRAFVKTDRPKPYRRVNGASAPECPPKQP